MSDPVTSARARRARRARDPRSREYMVRYSGTPIRHTEFGIRESEFGNRGTGNLHGAVFSLLTLMDMVR